jgi:segregation and condensation protein A
MEGMVHISVEGFDGPVGTLLDLIEGENLDITNLSLAQVADQYWSAIDSVETVDPDDITEFIAFGSKLLLVKSSALLEAPKTDEDDLDERIDEVSHELTELVREHKQFRDAVDLFRELEEEGGRVYARQAQAPKLQLPPGLQGVTVDSLRNAVREAIARTPDEAPEAVIEIEPVTVSEKVGELESALTKHEGRLKFGPLLQACETRTEIVVLFLAVLELIKAGQLWADQETAFGDIVLSREVAPAEA